MIIDVTTPLLVVADLDGTLAVKGVIPEATQEVLRQFKDRTTPLFTIATGRAIGSIEAFISLCTTDIVSEGGARRTNPRTRMPIEVHQLDEVSITWLEYQLEQGNITCASYAPNGQVPYVAFLKVGTQGSSLFSKDGAEFVDANEFIARVKHTPPSRVNFRWGQNRVTVPFGMNVAWNEGSVDLLPQGVSKATAVRALAERLGIPFDRIVVIGNDLNDLSMFQLSSVHTVVVGDLLKELFPNARTRVSTPHDLAPVLQKLLG